MKRGGLILILVLMLVICSCEPGSGLDEKKGRSSILPSIEPTADSESNYDDKVGQTADDSGENAESADDEELEKLKSDLLEIIEGLKE